ncbi:hypothetical protein BDZ89DRAFT_1073224 [Hymenopellis radicata]|nr:hypothetical protein BDZ89DRAFT_1073224 [Hymenopellis radicata]
MPDVHSLAIDFLHELPDTLTLAFRSIIPRLEDRIPITLHVAPVLLMSYIPFMFMAYLARREDTYLIRLLLLPTVITTTLWSSFTHYWSVPILNVYNWGQCLSGIAIVGKAIQYALTPEGMLKVDEIRAGVVKGKAVHRNGIANGYVKDAQQDDDQSPSIFGPWFWDIIELAYSLRGQRFKFGRGVHIPKHDKPLERGPFLKATLYSFVRNFLLLDVLETVLKLFPGAGSIFGGSMFYYNLPPLQRYAVSTFVHILTGSALLAGFRMVFELSALIAVGLFDDLPVFWPPVLDEPWSAQSMHELWAIRWHQFLRQTFYVYGGYLGRKIAGNAGLVFGMFIASGLFHEAGMYGMGGGWHWAPVVFFASQGPLLLLERLWRKVTGRRVGGWPGQLWVYFVMFVLAQPMIDSWHQRGLGGGLVIPPLLSPTRHLLSSTGYVINSNDGLVFV